MSLIKSMSFDVHLLGDVGQPDGHRHATQDHAHRQILRE